MKKQVRFRKPKSFAPVKKRRKSDFSKVSLDDVLNRMEKEIITLVSELHDIKASLKAILAKPDNEALLKSLIGEKDKSQSETLERYPASTENEKPKQHYCENTYENAGCIYRCKLPLSHNEPCHGQLIKVVGKW